MIDVSRLTDSERAALYVVINNEMMRCMGKAKECRKLENGEGDSYKAITRAWEKRTKMFLKIQNKLFGDEK